MATGTPSRSLSNAYDLPQQGTSPLSVPSWAYVKNVLLNMTTGNFTRDFVNQSTTAFCTIGTAPPASPYTGELWIDTANVPHSLKRYDGTRFVSIWHVGATAPATTDAGLPWYDTTLNIPRVYDITDGITGWHPSVPGYWLMKNTSSGQIPLGGVLEGNFLTADNGRDVAAANDRKTTSVVGVAAEVIEGSSVGVVAIVGGGAVVDVMSDPASSNGVVAIGDVLVASGTTSYEARTGGAFALSAPDSGLPRGAFAVAVAAKDPVTDLVQARMLSSIGYGRRKFSNPVSTNGVVTADVTAGTWLDVDVSAPPTGSGIDSKHLPVHGVELACEFAADGGAGGTSVEFDIEVASDQAGATWGPAAKGSYKGKGDSNGIYSVLLNIPFVMTPNFSNTFSFKFTEIAGTMSTANLRITGYYY